MAKKKTQEEHEEGDLDYRSNYRAAPSLPQPGMFPEPYRHQGYPQANPWTVGTWIMIGSGAVLAGATAFYVYTRVKKNRAQQPNPVRQLHVVPAARHVPTSPQAA